MTRQDSLDHLVSPTSGEYLVKQPIRRMKSAMVIFLQYSRLINRQTPLLETLRAINGSKI